MATGPSTIGRLQVGDRIGAGGFATVWLAHDPELDAPVAVKVLADNWAANPEVRQRFADEARLLRRVDNDRVVRVYDVGALPDGRPYLVMTYADAGSLADRMLTTPPPWEPDAVVGLVESVAAGLEALHAHGIVHRDAHPRNILFRRTAAGEQVLLGDLGIAKDLRWASGLTLPAGTAGYQAPEQQVVSADVGPATDVHALAVVAATLLGVAGPRWPATPVGAVLRRATETDPHRRTATPSRFAAELRTAVGGLPRPVDRASVRRGRGPLTVLVALAVLATVVGLGWVATGRPVRYVSQNGRVAVAVAGDWTPAPALVPGETTGEGVRLVSGGRSVSVAFAPVDTEPGRLATRLSGPACPTVQPQLVQAPDLRGRALAWSGCPGAATVAVAGLADPARPGWVVWVEVRAVDDSPTLEDVLRGLSVRP